MLSFGESGASPSLTLVDRPAFSLSVNQFRSGNIEIGEPDNLRRNEHRQLRLHTVDTDRFSQSI